MSESADFGDLLTESSLWQIYRKSKGVYHNRFNAVLLVVAAVVLIGFAIVHFLELGPARFSFERMDFSALFSSWASVGISFSSQLLGFLIAGFAVFFGVLRPHTAVALLQIKRKGEKLYELKLILVTFVDVFVHYTAFLGWCLVYVIVGSKNGPADWLGTLLSYVSPSAPSAMAHAVFVCWGIWFLVIILKLKGFIYNLYQTLILAMADSDPSEMR